VKNKKFSISIVEIYVTTLGYGDFQPTCPKTRFLVILELLFFFIFLTAKLPLAVSALRLKEEGK